MNVPSGVRSVIYIAVPIAYVITVVPSTNPVIITCGIGLCIGAGILAWRNASALMESDTPTQIKTSSSSAEGLEADSYTDVMDVAPTSEWPNYPLIPTTKPREPQGYPLSPGEYVLQNGDFSDLSLYGYSKALGEWLDNEPKPPPDRSWVTTELVGGLGLFESAWKRRSKKPAYTTKHNHVFDQRFCDAETTCVTCGISLDADYD